MKRIIYVLAVFLLVAISFNACKKWTDSENTDSGEKLMENLVIAENFDWKTTKSINISISLPEFDPSLLVRIYSEDLESLLYIGYGNSSTNSLNSKLTVPANLSTVIIYYGFESRYAPILLGVDSDLIYDYNAYDDLKEANAGYEDCGCDEQIKTLTMQYNGTNAASILVDEKGRGGSVIFDNTIQPGGSFSFTGSAANGDMKNDIEFYINGTLNTTIKVDCNYYLYNGDVFGDFTIIAGTSHGNLPLCDEIYECDCHDRNRVVFLTLRYLGSSAASVTVKEEEHNRIIFSGTVQPNTDFSFTGSKSDGKIDNKIKIYIGNTKNAEFRPDCADVFEIGHTHGDFSIVAGYNKYNLSLCGEIEDPSQGGGGNTTNNLTGSLAFEDLWPSLGDFDFNDLVIQYDFTTIKDDQDRVLRINATFTINAFGASFHNAFGFELPNVANNQIISITGYIIEPHGIFNIAANGLELGQSNATIIVFDDTYNVMTHPGVGVGVNTVDGAPYVTPEIVNLELVFYNDGAFAAGGPITFGDLDIGNFNPFIVINQVRGKEVHLPDYAPTSLADQSLFGTLNDDSDPSSDRYYKSENNLSWAIQTPSVFEYPYEKSEIIEAYINFGEWAESRGAKKADWYVKKAENRNENHIYKKK